MDPIVLSLRECRKGWRVFQGELPLFWFSYFDEAIATAQMVAEVHVEIREVAATIEVQLLGEAPVLFKTVAPIAQDSVSLCRCRPTGPCGAV